MRARDLDIPFLPGIEWTGAAAAIEPADHAERRRALDPTRSFIVQAPAGSGKTELLIQRFLSLLARVAEPESIAAITFTVKAAGEMRSRVLDALRKAADNAAPNGSHEAFTLDLAREAIARDVQQGWHLLDNPDRLRIQTIDALSMSITRQMPWLSRFGAMPDVTEDARDLYREAAQRGIEMLDFSACLLQHLDNDVSRAIALLAGMLETRDHWLRVLGVRADPAEARRALETSLEQIVSNHLARLRATLPPHHLAELIALARYAGANVEADDELACCVELTDPGTAHWIGLRRMLLTGKGDWRKSPNRGDGFPPSNKMMKARFEHLRDALAGIGGLRELLDDVAKLPACRYTEAQWEVLSALFQLLPVTVAHLRTVFAETGKVDFLEIAAASRRALGDHDQPTDLALAMGAHIEHLLVDEFQDTSVTQFELLRAITAGWEDDGRTVFLVGDPMQSIYRFRQAEVALFLNVQAAGLGTIRPEPLALTANFRSARPVVDWINRQFQTVFPAEADPRSGAVPYSASEAFREGAAGAAVAFHPFAGRDDQAEADLVLDIIERTELGRRIAILVRSRAHLITIAELLRARRVRYRAIEIQTLGEKSVIQDLLALTRALLHLGDRVAWLAVLRAPWCGMTLAELHDLAAADHSRSIIELLEGSDSPAVAVLRQALADRGRLPVSHLVERTWIALGGDRIAGTTELADARAYFDLLEQTGRTGEVLDLDQLAGRVRDLSANPDGGSDAAVELMTIHKAKGLEFDTVILPGLGKRPKSDDAPLLLWTEYPDETGTQLLMAPIAARRNGEDQTYDFIRCESDAKARNESQRLLYVACTRARTSLHLMGHVENGDPPRGSLLAHIWPSVQSEFDSAGNVPPPQPQTRQPRWLRRLRAGLLPPAVEPATGEARARMQLDRGARETGTLIHQILERIAQGCVPECDDPAVTGAIARTLDDDRGRWILAAHEEARSEFAVTAILEGELHHLAIDRTFIENGTRWVIDFKTGDTPLSSHRAQLRRYAEAMRAIDARPTRAGLYSPITGEWAEWDPFE